MAQASHFVLGAPGDPVLLSLLTTKSGQRLQDAPEAVVISGVTVSARIRAMVPKLRPGERRFFKRLCTDTRLPALSWRPYSLRRGRATAHFLEYGSLDKTAIEGRWSSTKTAGIYIDEAVST